MTRKLFVFASGGCCEESPDSPANQEVSLELKHDVSYISTRYVLILMYVFGNATLLTGVIQPKDIHHVFGSLSLQK